MIYMRNVLVPRNVLYYARPHSGRHRTLNHNEMATQLQRAVSRRDGWILRVVDADEPRTAREQRALFASANVAIVAHGAGMANYPFMHDGAIAILDTCTPHAFWSTFMPTAVRMIRVCNRLRKDDANDIWNYRGVYMDITGVMSALVSVIAQPRRYEVMRELLHQ